MAGKTGQNFKAHIIPTGQHAVILI